MPLTQKECEVVREMMIDYLYAQKRSRRWKMALGGGRDTLAFALTFVQLVVLVVLLVTHGFAQ